MLFQLKQSLANTNFKIKITKLLVTSLNQHVLLIINYCNRPVTNSYNKLINLKNVIQKIKNKFKIILRHWLPIGLTNYYIYTEILG